MNEDGDTQDDWERTYEARFQLFRFEVIGEQEAAIAAIGMVIIGLGFQLFRFEVIGERS